MARQDSFFYGEAFGLPAKVHRVPFGQESRSKELIGLTEGQLQLVMALVAAGRFKNSAYVTTLAKAELVTTIEALVQRWKCGSKGEVLHDRAKHGWVPDGAMLEAVGGLLKDYVPAGVGFALLFGKGGASQYLATCDRDGMAKLFEDDLLPTWRAEAT